MDKNEKPTIEATQNDKFSWFAKTVKMVHEYGKGTVLFSIVVFFLVLTIIINPINIDKIFERKDNEKSKRHIELMEKRDKANQQIPLLLSSMLFQTNAERAMIFEFHNGGTNHSDLPFYRFSCSYEVIKKHVDQYVSDSYQNQNVADYWQTIKNLEKTGYLFYNNIDSAECVDRTFYKVKKDGTNALYFSRLYDNNGNFIGAVIMTSSVPNSLDYSNISEVCGRYRQQIGSLLTGVINERRR